MSGFSQTSTWLALLLALLAFATPSSAASLLDPRLGFRTLSTAHFFIYFHQGEEATAQRLAAIAEDTWPRVGAALGVTAPKRTHVILADQSELANGWATPLPYNTIFVTAVAPSGSEFIGRNDDWLRMVFTHEFTHIVHLDRSEGWARIFRGLFGRTPIAFPNVFLPQWMVEGLATYEESAITGQGRRAAGDFRAIEREAARTGRLEPLDRANGGLTDWPGGSAGYASGLGFHEFLADRYGADRFGELARVTAGTAPFAGAMAFDSVYGQSVDALWKQYGSALKASVEREPASVAAPSPTRLTHDGFVALAPRVLPPACSSCPPRVVFARRTPHAFPALMETDLSGAVPRTLTSRYLGATTGHTGDRLVFDQLEVRRNVGFYSDLYVLDLRSGHVEALTHEARLQDPDVSPDGASIVAVRQHGEQRDLVVVPFSGASVGEPRVLVSETRTSFNAPRWSPDGRSIAVARHAPGAQSEIVIVDADSGAVRTVAAAQEARIVTPTWTPDGQAIVAAAAKGAEPFNLYEFSISGDGRTARPLTAVSGGATWPEITSDGQTIVFVGYTSDGFDLFSLPYPSTPPSRTLSTSARPDSPSSAGGDPSYATAAYSPWRTLTPVTWVPIVETGDQIRAGALVSGVDVLARHSWSASATWLVDAPEGAVRPNASSPDWSASYVYDRWRPALFANASRQTVFFAGLPDAEGVPSSTTIRQGELEAGVYLPFRHTRVTHRLLASVVAMSEHAMPQVEILDQDRVLLRAAAATSTAHVFGYSISPERGMQAGGTIEMTRRAWGSSDDATVVTGDVRAYLPGAGEHHVVALRAAGGVDVAGHGAGRVFLLGGAAPSLDVIDFGREAISMLRGFPTRAAAGSHVAVMNADYRFPIARPQRGVGVWPLFLHTVHAAAFADVGSAWTSGWSRSAVKSSVGGELSLDVIAGFSFPATVAFGAGWGHDGRDQSSRGTFYLRVGRAF